MNKQQLANKIWASANKMRSKIEANEYKDYILGLIFYKFLSDNEVNYLKSIGWTDEDIVTLVEDHENQEAVMMMEYCVIKPSPCSSSSCEGCSGNDFTYLGNSR